MRLLDTSTFELHQFLGDCPEDYAILSHTWLDDECTFQDMATPDVTKKKGWNKIKFCCEQAARDGYKWAWVDTCCIDKKNNSELSEAINSMFRWYKLSKVCYAYLADVTDPAGIASSRWFTRGWTLQELIAPQHVWFYSSNWTYMGSKSDLADTIYEITGIDKIVLSTGVVSHVSVATRMSWAAKRTTTLIEDMAYSLVGIFGIFMPFIYGEGEKAFLRLQQAIMEASDDQSLFAWGAPEIFDDMGDFSIPQEHRMQGLLASSPSDFLSNHEILTTNFQKRAPPLIEQYGGAVRLGYPICTQGPHDFILLACTTRSAPRWYIGIPVKTWKGSTYARCGSLVRISREDAKEAQTKILVMKEPQFEPAAPFPGIIQLFRAPNKTRPREQDHFMLDEVYCLPHATYSASEHSIAFSPERHGPQATFFFTPGPALDSEPMSATRAFSPHDFAIVLGYSGRPWTMYVPIRPDICADADTETIGKTTDCCMEKSQLKNLLLQGNMEALPPRKSQLDEPISVWAKHGTSRTPPNLRVAVSLDIAPVNLIEDGVFVSIDIYEVFADQTASKRDTDCTMDLAVNGPTEERDISLPKWMIIEEFEWFKVAEQSDNSRTARCIHYPGDGDDDQNETHLQRQRSIDDDCAGGPLSSFITENPIVTAGYAVASFLLSPYLRNRK